MLTSLFFFFAIVPVAISYFVYKHYSLEKFSFSRSLDSILFGILAAAFLVVLGPIFDFLLPNTTIFQKVFFHAALVEKLIALIVIYFISRRYHPISNISDSVATGIFYALGFSALENIFYAYDIQKPEVVIRFFSSVPLHITTCAILSYYLGIYFLSKSLLNKIYYLSLSFVIPTFFHFLYDYSLLKSGYFTYIIAPELVTLISIQEYLLAKSSALPSNKELRINHINIENWFLLQKQLEYERWILLSMGKRNPEIVPFFDFYFSSRRKLVIFFLIFFSFGFAFFFERINQFLQLDLKPEEQLTLFSFFPFVGAFNIFLAGSINHEYFKSSVLSLPVVAEIKLWYKQEENLVNATDISLDGCFIKTLESLEVGETVELVYSYASRSTQKLRAKVIWDNHENLLEPIGTLLKIEQVDWKLIWFLIRFRFFRFTRGIIFHLKIPGFEKLRNHFVKEITVMEDHAYVTEGTILFREGETGKEFYFLKKGKVEIYKTTENGEELRMAIVEPGNIFGEMSMITGQPRAASARCLTNCLISTSNADNLEALVLNNPEFSYKLLKTLAFRISSSEQILMQRIKELEKELEECKKKESRKQYKSVKKSKSV